MEKPKFQRVTKKRSKAALRGAELAVVEMSIKSILLHPTLPVKKRKSPLVERVFHYIYKICT